MVTIRLRHFTLLCLALCSCGAGQAQTLFLNGNASSVSILKRSDLTEASYVAAPGLTTSVTLSADGTRGYLAAGRILAVNPVTHRVTGALPSNSPTRVRLSPDGSRLYAANADGSVWVYDTGAGTVVQHIPFHVKDAALYTVSDLQISADGSLLVLGSLESLCDEEGCPPGDPPALITEIDAQGGTLVRRISVPYVASVAIAGNNQSLYVADYSAITQLDAASGNVLQTIDFPASKLSLDATAGRLYAGTSAAPYTLEIFSTSNNSLTASVPLPGPATALSFTPDHSTVFAGGCIAVDQVPAPCPITEIATATWTAAASGTLFGPPADFASAGSNRLWVANGAPVELTAVNTQTNRVSGEAEAGYGPSSLLVTPSGNKVYTANLDGSISVIDGHTLARLKVLTVAEQEFNLSGAGSVSPDGQRAYLVLNHVQVLDTGSDQVIGTIPELPFGITVSPDSQTLYTDNATYNENLNSYQLFVSKYSAATLQPMKTATFLSDQLPTRLFVSPDGATLYLVVALKAYVIDSSTLHTTRTIALNDCVDAALSLDGATLYCLDQPFDTLDPDTIDAISTADGSVTRSYSTGASGFGSVALTPDGKTLYVSLSIPGATVPGVLEQIDLASGTIQLANTTLSGMLAIQ